MVEQDRLEQRVAELEAEIELLRAVINHLPNTIYAKDKHSKMVLVNRAQADLLDTDAAIGKTDFDFYPSELAQKYYEDEQRIFESGDPLIDIEEQVLDAQGRVRWYLTTKIPLYDASGDITHIAGIGRDITDRRRLQEGLKALNEVSITLSNTVSFDDLCRLAVELGQKRLGFDRIGCWFIDEADPTVVRGGFGIGEDGNIRDERHIVHPIESFCVDFDSDQNVTVTDNIPLRDERQTHVGLGWRARTFLRNGDHRIGWIVTDNLLRHEPLRSYHVEILALYGALVGHLCVRKRTDDALRESEERFRQIAENIHAVIFVRDVVHGSLLYVSPTFETVWQQPVASLYTQPDLLDKLLVDESEFQVTRPDGETRWIARQTFPIHDDQGNVYREVCIAEDITERKMAEQQRIELAAERKRMHVLREFIRDAYHEFRTPLSLINTKIYLAQRSGDPQRCFQNMEAIKTESNRILTLVDALVTMTRLDTDYVDEIERINLNLMLHDLFTALHERSQEKNLDFQLHLPKHMLQVMGNRFELWQALHHVAENAIRYTPADGCVTISADNEGDAIVIHVQDTGDGIPQADLDRIFERFYRRDESHTTPGFGLGLPIARKSVEKAGGTITVESESGVGSTFIIRLPLQ